MVTDYERAWTLLAAHVASKSQHGREGTLQKMAEIAEQCAVPAGELSRLLRLYGVEVERARSIAAETERSASGDFAGGDLSSADDERAAHHRPEGGHDVVSGNGSARGIVGR